jgi:hypothetical protein
MPETQAPPKVEKAKKHIQYTGASMVERRLTKADFTKAEVEFPGDGNKPLVWNSDNEHKVDATGWTEEQVALVTKQPNFKLVEPKG